MNTEQFHKAFPVFKYRLVVKKPYIPSKSFADGIRRWLEETFGPKGERWERQPAAHPAYLVYWFKDERDLLVSQLRWA